MPITDRNLAPGTILVATFKKVAYRCEVVETEQGTRYRYGETEFKSASAAASAVMKGASANGWRFWSVEGNEPAAGEQTPKPEKARKVATKTIKAPTPEAASKVEARTRGRGLTGHQPPHGATQQAPARGPALVSAGGSSK